jgi:hypothetical protein
LTRKRDGCAQKLADLQRRREDLGWGAHVGGDRAARAQLTKLHQEIGALASESESFRAAIVQQQTRIAAAQHHEEGQRRRAVRERGLALCQEMVDAAQFASEALTAFGARYRRLDEITSELYRLNVGAHTPAAARIHVDRAVRSVLAPLGLGQTLPPSQRCSLEHLVRGWCGNIEARCRESGDDEEAAQ